MKFSTKNIHHSEINAIDTDFKGETIAANLLCKGLSPEQILFFRKEGNKRGVLKDIIDVNVKNSKNVSDQESIEIIVRRNGIYDSLPEGLFHKTGISARSREQVLENMRKQREEEFYNRRFFQVFEEEMDRNKMMAHLKELNFYKKNTNSEYTKIFKSFWPVINDINPRRAALFMEIVPHFYHIRLSHKLIEKALILIFELNVKISSCFQKEPNPLRKELKLGSMKLGENFITYGDLNDRIQNTVISIGPMSAERYSCFGYNGKDRLLLQELLKALFPANCKVITKYLINENENKFKLKTSSLGVNTCLC